MFKCPSCGKHSISLWKKLNLSPLSVIECKECGKSLTAPWWVSSLSLASSFLIIISLFFKDISYLPDIFIIAYLVFLISYIAFIPMIVKKESRQ